MAEGEELLDGLETVSEDAIADAMVFLVERAKLVAEGAGAVAVAVLLSGRLAPVAGTTVAIVSGGNVDGGLLASLLRRRETSGRWAKAVATSGSRIWAARMPHRLPRGRLTARRHR